jgi:hypothetical protein
MGTDGNSQRSGGSTRRHTDKAAFGKKQVYLLLFQNTARRAKTGENPESVGNGFKTKLPPELARRNTEKFEPRPFHNGAIHAGIGANPEYPAILPRQPGF